MIGDVSHAEHIYIVCGYTDMRKAIDGLAAIVQQNFGLDVFSGSLFLFCGKLCPVIILAEPHFFPDFRFYVVTVKGFLSVGCQAYS